MDTDDNIIEEHSDIADVLYNTDFQACFSHTLQLVVKDGRKDAGHSVKHPV